MTKELLKHKIKVNEKARVEFTVLKKISKCFAKFFFFKIFLTFWHENSICANFSAIFLKHCVFTFIFSWVSKVFFGVYFRWHLGCLQSLVLQARRKKGLLRLSFLRLAFSELFAETESSLSYFCGGFRGSR